MSLIPVGFGASGDYTIDDSLRFRSDANAYLSRTPASAGNRNTWTWSGWVKKTDASSGMLFAYYGSGADNNYLYFIGDIISYKLEISNAITEIRTTPVFRDHSAWYHIVLAIDTTQATASDRTKLYVNGSQVTSFSSESYPTQNTNTFLNSNVLTTIGGRSDLSSSLFYDGYLTEVNFIDGQALDPTEFGEINEATGVWKPKEYTGTYGTNGFYLPMTPTTQAELQNSVLWTGTGDAQSIDGLGFSPDLVWIKKREDGASVTNRHHVLFDTLRGTHNQLRPSLQDAEQTIIDELISFDSDGFTVGDSDNVGGANTPYIAWAWDAGTSKDAEVIRATWSETGYSTVASYPGETVTYTAPVTGTYTVDYLGGGDQAASSGATGLSSSGTMFNWGTHDFSVNGTSQLTWQGAYLTNSGGSQTYTRQRAAQNGSTTISLTAGDTITVTIAAANADQLSGTYYQGYKGAPELLLTPPNNNSDGDIDSRVKANTDKGFSIVSWEGNGSNSTIGHGLSSAPEFFFLKNRDTSINDWIVYHSDAGATKFLRLNQTNATTTQSDIFNDTAPTSSVLSVGTNSAVNTNGVNYIAYCFHSVAGYSDFGSYTGTGVAGLSVTTGFRPAFVMIKKTNNATNSNWNITDSTRSPSDTVNSVALRANTTDTETIVGTAYVKFTDTGFEITGTSTETNESSSTYIYIAFADTRDEQFNFDSSGNKNNWIPNNINSNAYSDPTYDLMKDVPTLNGEDASNFATWNPLDIYSTSYIPTYSDGSLKVYHATRTYAWSNLGLPSGKWYAEVELDTLGSGLPTIGIAVRDSTNSLKFTNYISNGNKIVNGTSTSYGSSYIAGDCIGISFDADTGDVTFYKNGVSQGSISNSDLVGSTTNNVPARIYAGHSGSLAANATWILNAGQRPFKYTPPAGFLKMNTYNLPDSTIVDGSEQFNTVLWTGDGVTTGRDIAGISFQPDLVWGKSRSSAYDALIFDAVRGSTKSLTPSSTSAEVTNNANGYLSAFNADGFEVTGGSSTVVSLNQSGQTYVGWTWKANGSGVTNTDGSIDSTVSANTTAGFSIATYTSDGASTQTFGHGLGVTPSFVIIKARDRAGERWPVWHQSLATNGYIALNEVTAASTGSTIFQTAGITSSVIAIGNNASVGLSGTSYICYAFATVEGFSKFGSYTGNGSTDGPFVYTGFRPAWILLKESSAGTEHWFIYDNKRNGYNLVENRLMPNLSNAEDALVDMGDFVSNGFKIRPNGTYINQFNRSGATIIYAAFAENPFKNSLAR